MNTLCDLAPPPITGAALAPTKNKVTTSNVSADFVYTPLTRDNMTAQAKAEQPAFLPLLKNGRTADVISCCLTAYNEPFEAYRATLSGLLQGACYLHDQGHDAVAGELLICVLIDGLANLSPGFATWARQVGIMSLDLIDDTADLHIFEAHLPRGDLIDSLSNDTPLIDNPGEAPSPADFSQSLGREQRQRILVLIKKQNCGKLDSHRCFFDLICHYRHADYLLQVDAGTAPEREALLRLWSNLRAEPTAAATAAKSLLPAPTNKFNLLHVWQYCDMVIERTVNWPGEVLLGKLTVLPGQLNMARARAILPSAARKEENEQNEQKIEKNHNEEALLKTYYRGFEQLGLFESNMYLAEDRILALEIIFQNDPPWQLTYTCHADATTDPCTSWQELCKQRRRWLCSATACRLAMLAKLPKSVLFQAKQPQDSAGEGARGVLSMCYFLLCTLLECFVPAFYLIAQSTLTQLNLSLLTNPAAVYFFNTLLFTAFGCTALQLLIALSPKAFKKSQHLIGATLWAQCGCFSFALLSFFALSLTLGTSYIVFVTFATLALSYTLVANLYGGRLIKPIAGFIVQYLLCRLPIKAFLQLYSMCNFHDVSWGTKGLENVTTQHQASDRASQQRQRQGYAVVALFIAGNALVYTAASYAKLFDQQGTLLVFYALPAVQLLMSVLAFAFLKPLRAAGEEVLHTG